MRLLLLSSSLQGERCASAMKQLEAALLRIDEQLDLHLLDLGRLDVEFFDGRELEEYNQDTQRVIEEVLCSNFIVFGMPVFQASIPGSLKNVFDLLPRYSLQNKAAAIVCIAGSHRYHLVPQYQLMPVLHELRANCMDTWLDIHESAIDIMGEVVDAELFIRINVFAADLLAYAKRIV